MGDFFSRTAMSVVGILLLTAIATVTAVAAAAWALGPAALEAWLG